MMLPESQRCKQTLLAGCKQRICRHLEGELWPWGTTFANHILMADTYLTGPWKHWLAIHPKLANLLWAHWLTLSWYPSIIMGKHVDICVDITKMEGQATSLAINSFIQDEINMKSSVIDGNHISEAYNNLDQGTANWSCENHYVPKSSPFFITIFEGKRSIFGGAFLNNAHVLSLQSMTPRWARHQWGGSVSQIISAVRNSWSIINTNG